MHSFTHSLSECVTVMLHLFKMLVALTIPDCVVEGRVEKKTKDPHKRMHAPLPPNPNIHTCSNGEKKMYNRLNKSEKLSDFQQSK